MGFYRRTGKRAFDLVATALAAPLLLPLALLVAAVVRLSLGRPVLFRQLRPGLGGRPFTILKFRTMTASGSDSPANDAARLTRVGQLLRSTSLDELPEFLNVVRGEMSLVGPRPLLMQYLERYEPWQQRRHEVLPGITGWAQVNGRNAISWEEKFALDGWYVEHRSVLLDAHILLLTLKRVMRRTGINATGSATAEKFRGQP
jgi:lipopolysaccharide/colanic/teichoic acid biosynthesis glycosyltransferase